MALPFRFRLLPNDREMGWTPYLWLIYLPFFIVSPTGHRISTETWILRGIGTLAFLALYFAGHWLRGKKLYPIIGGIVLIGVLFFPVNPGAGVFFIYAAAFAGDAATSVGGAMRMVIGIALVLLIETAALRLPLFQWAWAFIFVFVVGAINAHYGQVGRMNAKLRIAQEELEQMAKVAERERIARDLHDVVGHTLSLIVLKSELASKLAERDPARAVVEIRDVERISRDALAEVRRAVQGYRASGLVHEVLQSKKTLESAGVETTTELVPLALGSTEEAVLALIVREAVTNVIRHAAAKHCRISVSAEPTAVSLRVEDDGRGGFSPEGLGLRGMRERVESLGGTLERNTEGGTKLMIRIPRRAAPVASMENAG